MKRKLVCAAIVLLAIMFSHAAFAAPPDLLGEWNGSGKAIMLNGDVLSFDIMGEVKHQEGNLLAGYFEFTLLILNGEDDQPPVEDLPPVNDLPTFRVAFTGHISQNKSITLLMSAMGFDGEVTLGSGVAEAKWMGNKIEGVVRDFLDGSTGYFFVEPANEVLIDETRGNVKD